MNIIIKNWWKDIDKFIFILSLTLLAIGTILSITGTTDISNFETTYFMKRHLIFVFISVFIIIIFSIQDDKFIRRVSFLGVIISIVFMLYIFLIDYEINGSKRWLPIFGFTIQPSEFLKTFFVVISAWFLNKGLEGKKYGFNIILPIFIISSTLLILQPDFGMTILFMIVFFAQLFVAGLSIFFVIILGLIIFIVSLFSYYFIDNVKRRVDLFFDPSSGDTFQISQSLLAFKSGGFFGKGLGNGILKNNIPDAHTDFIFSVAGEEFGYIFCSIIIFIFLTIIIRSLVLAIKKREPHSLILVVGLICLFGFQALINIASSINAIPTKGMTLPLISYGGSSMLSSSILIGILLSYTKKFSIKK